MTGRVLAAALLIGCPVPVLAQSVEGAAGTAQGEVDPRDAIIAELTARVERLERILGDRWQAETAKLRPDDAATISPDIERALERSLVQDGTAIIAPGSVELVPSISYAFASDDVPLLLPSAGDRVVISSETRRSFLEARMGARLGLPGNSQLNVAIPYRIVIAEDVASIGGSPIASVQRTASSFGDISVGVSHVISGGGQAVPRLVGQIRGNLGTASRKDGRGLLGGRFPSLGGSISASQRFDPIVLAGSLSYDRRFAEKGLKPGDRWGYSLTAYLAASPEVSLRTQFSQQFFGDARFNDAKVEGSGNTSASLSFGASVVRGRGALIDLGVAVGLTESAPDFALTLAAPIRVKR